MMVPPWLFVKPAEVSQPTSAVVRLGLIAGSLGLMASLAISGWLIPDERGYGTHQQLGFPPCSTQWLWGVPCPSCGMTTSWSWLVRGEWQRAAEANLGGVALAVYSVLAAPWLLVSGCQGRWWGGLPRAWFALAAGGIVLGLTAVSWLGKLYHAL